MVESIPPETSITTADPLEETITPTPGEPQRRVFEILSPLIHSVEKDSECVRIRIRVSLDFLATYLKTSRDYLSMASVSANNTVWDYALVGASR